MIELSGFVTKDDVLVLYGLAKIEIFLSSNVDTVDGLDLLSLANIGAGLGLPSEVRDLLESLYFLST
jgi:hypothetical protein